MSTGLSRFWILCLVVGFEGMAPVLAGPRRVPISEDEILVRLPAGLPRVASVSSANNPSLPDVITQANDLVRMARHAGDPRLLTRAEGLLQPWWTSNPAPLEVCLLRARIRQGLHAFPEALMDLDAALHQDPRNPEAWLLKATIHEVRGEDASARHACLQLARFADELTALTAAAGLATFGDDGGTVVERLADAIRRNSTAPSETRAWAWTTLGELQTQRGQWAAAETSFRTSLSLEPQAVYTLGDLADLMLERGNFQGVVSLLGQPSADALRLRLAEAEERVQPGGPQARRLIQQLDEAFELATFRGDDLHLREHARFLLRLKHDAGAALPRALRNWSIQKEPADLQLLIDASEAAGDSESRAAACEWLQRHHHSSLRQAPAAVGRLDSLAPR